MLNFDHSQLPKAEQIEDAVLGTFMLFPESFGLCSGIVYQELFTSPDRKFIFDACKALFLENKPIDILTVSDWLHKNEKKVKLAYIGSLTSKTNGTAALENNVLILNEKYFTRETILKARQAIFDSFEGKDIFDVLNELQSDLNSFTGKLITDNPKTIFKLLKDWENKKIEIKNGLTGINTGFKCLNDLTGGWQSTDLVILAGRPGMGKTSFILNTALTAARQNKKVLLFSLEMGAEQFIQRLLSSEAEIDLKRLRQKNIFPEEVQKYAQAQNSLLELPIFIDDSSKANLFTIKTKMLNIKKNYGLDMVIIDFLQLVKGDNKNSNRNEELDQITQNLKALAKEFNIPIIGLSQLSRSVESRPNKRPMLSDLRESGGIEQNADLVGFLYRPEYYGIMQDENGESTQGKAELIIAKHRNGSTDDLALGWLGRYTKFFDLETEQSQDFKPVFTNNSLKPNNEFF